MNIESYFKITYGLYLVTSEAKGQKTGYVANKLANELYNKFKPKELDDVKVLFLMTSPPHMLFASHETPFCE